MDGNSLWTNGEIPALSLNEKIDRISGVQLENGTRTYLVHWKTEESSCWMPEEKLSHAKDAVKIFITTLMSTFISDNIDLRHKKKKKKKHKDRHSEEHNPSPKEDENPLSIVVDHGKYAPKEEVLGEEEEETSEFAITTVPFETNASPQEQINKAIMEQISSIHLPNITSTTNHLPNTSSSYYPAENNYLQEPSSSSTNLYSFINQPPLIRPISPPNFLAQNSLRDELGLNSGILPIKPDLDSSYADTSLNHSNLLNVLFSSGSNNDLNSAISSSKSDYKSLPKQYMCKICNVNFKKSTHLSRHIRTHTGDKPFQCKYCPKAFARSDNLLVHERIHTGEKPHQCQYCAKAFPKSDKLKRHEALHHGILGDKPHNCEICGRMFNSKGDKKRHMGTHTEIPQEQLNLLMQ